MIIGPFLNNWSLLDNCSSARNQLRSFNKIYVYTSSLIIAIGMEPEMKLKVMIINENITMYYNKVLYIPSLCACSPLLHTPPKQATDNMITLCLG